MLKPQESGKPLKMGEGVQTRRFLPNFEEAKLDPAEKKKKAVEVVEARKTRVCGREE